MTFPTVAIIGSDITLPSLISAATSLGVHVRSIADGDLTSLRHHVDDCDLITFLPDAHNQSVMRTLVHEGLRVRPTLETVQQLDTLDTHPSLHLPVGEWLVLVARSPHGQATSWAPTHIVRGAHVMTVSPAPDLDPVALKALQKWALELAASMNLFGVLALVITNQTGSPVISQAHLGPHPLGDWTIDGAITNQYEQHIRAILDLPLGDPALRSPFIVTSEIRKGHKADMYRPYLHLMARTPELKFRYLNMPTADGALGTITLSGNNLAHITAEITHARDYLSGTIDD